MTDETTQQGASGFNADPPKELSFPQGGVDNDGRGGDNNDQVDPREELIAGIEARVQAKREAEMEGLIDASPDRGAEPVDEEQDEQTEPVMEQEPPADPPVKNEHLPEEFQDDPLADYIVMDEANDTPMFVTKVNGEEKYIPLDRARQQLQKHEAAEVSLQNANERQKVLDAREQQILASEQALKAKLAAPAEASPPSVPAAPDVSDQDLEAEAQGIVSSLFSGTEDDAVEHLAKVFKSMRPQQQAVSIDQNAIVEQAANLVDKRRGVKNAQQDAADGLKQFNDSYPDVAADQALFGYADSMTDVIAKEWTEEGRAFRTSEVMMEAGKRTTEWVQSMKSPSPKPKVADNDRHERKRKLRPMPTSQSQGAPTQQGVEPDQTPSDAVAEMRKARGQAF
jgi:hypothetical protein